MGEDRADVPIHIDETLSRRALQSVVEGLRKVEGLDAVTSSEESPHMIIVYYDLSRTNSLLLHKRATDQGVHAELIGM